MYKYPIVILLTALVWPMMASSPVQTQWTEVKRESGVIFYETHRDSRVNGMVHSIIKIENTNTYPVKVTFTPKIDCDGSPIQEKPLTCALDTKDSFQQQYKSCKEGTVVKVGVSNISIAKM